MTNSPISDDDLEAACEAYYAPLWSKYSESNRSANLRNMRAALASYHAALVRKGWVGPETLERLLAEAYYAGVTYITTHNNFHGGQDERYAKARIRSLASHLKTEQGT